ncbi:hypothetical protein POM88_015213 [Heracleum sosnowskyi]|uniref:Uncharacterized protein n=1 Tax=Heracleum sosnowskyi TaxID=360622 RepID=A0AAD8IJS5_9APIA|nr:hypothetical protein POM88_015213 [Heracleum sosnowskyi]
MDNIIEDMKKASVSKVNKQSSSNVNEESHTTKDELVELSKQCDYTAIFYVYHQTPTGWDDNFRDDGTYSDEEFNEIRKATKEDRLRTEEFEKEYETNNGSETQIIT